MRKYYTKIKDDKTIYIHIKNKCILRYERPNQIIISPFFDASLNPKAIWSVLNCITGNEKNSKHLKLSMHGVRMTDSPKIACAFNIFFINSVQILATNFNYPSPKHNSRKNSSEKQLFSFITVTQEYLPKVINSLNKTNATDTYSLNLHFVLCRMEIFLLGL